SAHSQSAKCGVRAMAIRVIPVSLKASGDRLRVTHAGHRAWTEIHLLVEPVGGEIAGGGADGKIIAVGGACNLAGTGDEMVSDAVAAKAGADEGMVQVHVARAGIGPVERLEDGVSYQSLAAVGDERRDPWCLGEQVPLELF